jgi:hypothetical protein
MGNDLAKTGVAVEGDDGAGVFHHAGMAVKLQKTFAMGFYVARDHADAVGIVSGKVGGDQVVCDQRGFGWRTAQLREQGSDEVV